MPVALPKMGREWKGKEFPWADPTEHEMIVKGQPFYILDALDHFGAPEEMKDGRMKYQVAFLVQLVEYDEHGDEHKLHTPFVWTRGESQSRNQLVKFVRDQVYGDNPDVVGPVQAVEVKPKNPAYSPFLAINAYGTDQTPESVGDDIPF